MTRTIITGRTRTILAALLVAALLTTTLLPRDTNTSGQGAPSAKTLQSLNVFDPPVLDGLADDPVWSDAVELVVEVKGGSAKGDVKLRSVYTDTDLYISAQWEDSTMSLTRSAGAWDYNPVPDSTLRSARTSTAPVIDGDGTDTVWEQALPLKVNLEFGTNPGEVTLRSLHTNTEVFFQAQWHDPTFSISRSSWILDTGTGDWSESDGLEDMVNMMWDVHTTGFDTVGCQAKCHIGKDWSYLDVEGDSADLWHIMASRSLPATEVVQLTDPTLVDYEATSGDFQLIGYGDDTQVVYDPDLGQFPTGGRVGDEGTASYTPNANATGGSPMYIETAPTDWLDAMVLQASEVQGGETIVADPQDPSYSAGDVASAWDAYAALGASVPEDIVQAPTGSRGDIVSGATWKDGLWTVETSRALVTGNDDDVQFDDLSRSYDFGVSTMNNTAGKGHNYITRPLHLDFLSDFAHPGDGDEDRMALLWEITPLTNFETAGCYIKCHPQYGTAGAFLENEGEMGDIWHTRVASSLPDISAAQSGDVQVNEDHEATSGTFSFHGYVDDRHLTYDEPPHVGEGGRHPDDGTSTVTPNTNPDGTKPIYMEMAPEDYIDAMVLQQTEIDDGQALEVASASALEVREAAQVYADLGALVPEEIMVQPTGSRADIEQAAVWSDGVWSVEIRRALVTGNDDDVQFDDIRKTYRFSIAVMDNSRGNKHSVPGTETVLLSLYVPPTSYDVTVGPILDSSGSPVAGADVQLWRNMTSYLNGTTNGTGSFNLTVPPEWADSTVEVVVSKDGYKNSTFLGVIDDQGGFFPVAGTYPEFLRKGEGTGGDDTPGMLAWLVLASFLAAVLVSTRWRRGGVGRLPTPHIATPEREM